MIHDGFPSPSNLDWVQDGSPCLSSPPKEAQLLGSFWPHMILVFPDMDTRATAILRIVLLFGTGRQTGDDKTYAQRCTEPPSPEQDWDWNKASEDKSHKHRSWAHLYLKFWYLFLIFDIKIWIILITDFFGDPFHFVGANSISMTTTVRWAVEFVLVMVSEPVKTLAALRHSRPSILR